MPATLLLLKMTTVQNVRSVLILTLVVVVGCQRDDATESGGPEAGRDLYPGASVLLPIERSDVRRLDAERGALRFSPGGDSVVYTAPLEPGTYSYSIVGNDSQADLLGNRINVVMAPAAELTDVVVGEASLAARYGDVSMNSTLADGSATAIWTSASADVELVVAVGADDTVSLTYDGQELDSYGALSAAEAATLDQLATGPLARAITMIPLDLGCVDGISQTDDLLFAPILLPWQMILKYEILDRGPVIREFFAESTCGFPGYFEKSTEKPFNSKVLWDVDHSVPSVHLVFPLDGHGQLSTKDDAR